MLPLLAAALLLQPQSDYRTRFPLPDAVVPQGWGVNVHLRGENEQAYDQLKTLGVKWARLDLLWSRVEKDKGDYDFSEYDVMLDRLKDRGIRPLVILDYGNSLYGAEAVRTREGRAAFAAYASAAVRRFRGRGIIWEVWNEPNHEKFWHSKPSADEYAALLRVTGEAIRTVSSQEYIAGPAVSKFDWPFIERVFQEGGLKYLDAVSVHPYRINQPPEKVADDWARLRKLIDQYAEGRKIAMINSEWGYSVTDKTMTPVKQGEYAVRQYLVNLASGVNLNIWYSFIDRGNDPGDREHNFGLLNTRLQPKPSFTSIQNVIKDLNGYRFTRRLDLGGPNDYALLFENGMKRKMAIWTTQPREQDLRLPASLAGFAQGNGRDAGPRTIRLKNAVQILEQRW
jgi:hypothetical protein